MRTESLAINHEKLNLLERLRFLKSKSLERYKIIVPYEGFKKSCPGEILLEFENKKEKFKDRSKKISLRSQGKEFSFKIALDKYDVRPLKKIYSPISLLMNDAIIEIIKRDCFNKLAITINISFDIKNKPIKYNEYIRCCDYKLIYYKSSFTENVTGIISLFFDNENEALEVYDNEEYITYIAQRFKRFLDFEKEKEDIIQKIREVDNSYKEENDKDHSGQINYLDCLSNKDKWVKNIVYESGRCILIKVPEKQD